MTVTALLSELERRGVRLQTDGSRVGFSPAGAVTPDLRQAIREHKPALLKLLSPPTGDSTFDDAPLGPPVADPFDEPPERLPCGHSQQWRSIYGPHLICATCHPPASPDFVAEWFAGTSHSSPAAAPSVQGSSPRNLLNRGVR